MPLIFSEPLALFNSIGSASNLTYAYTSASNLLCLYSNCADLAADATYVSKDFSGTPSTFGCWFPDVSSQSELNSNFTRITNAATQITCYLFFKSVSEDPAILHVARTLSTAFEIGTPVLIEDYDDEFITPDNFSSIRLRFQDGPVIIVGILDIGAEDKG